MKNSLVHNLSWVLIGSVIAKVLGGVYRVVLTRILGTDIGLYQIVFSAYSFLVILVSSGIPLAISKLVSAKKNDRQQQKILHGAMAILISISLVLAIALILGGRGLALIQGSGKIYVCYIILAPSLVLSAASAILKGYQQGKKEFRIPALANICEQIVRVVLGLVLMLALRRLLVVGALIGAMLGTLLGDVASFLFLKIFSGSKIKFKYSWNSVKDGKNVFKHSYQIMLYSLIVPFTNFIDSFLVVRLLGLHLPMQTSTLLYGLQSGAVSSIISIPGIFSFSLVSVLMPRLSADYANKNIQGFNKKATLAFKLILFISLPCAVFFAVNAGDVVDILYGASLNGFGVNGQHVAKNLLIISSVSMVFGNINQLSAIILQNLNKKNLPIINLSVGMVCKTIIELMFVPSKGIGIYAYSIASVVGFVVAGTLNLYSVEKFGVNMIDIKYLTKQFALGVVVLGLLTLFKFFSSLWITILGGVFTIIIYLVAGYVIKLFSKQDLNLINNTE